MDSLSDDELLGCAVRYLIEGNEREAANILLTCTLERYEIYEDPEASHWQRVYLTAPRAAYDVLNNPSNEVALSVDRAIHACYPSTVDVQVNLEVTPIDKNWREEMGAIARGKETTNQGATGEFAKSWANLQFGSETEVRIAKILDEKNVLFFPNCKGRLQVDSDNRGNLKPDFLVCYKGKWGILEVDGEPFHPPSRTVQDHSRDRLFLESGVSLVQHFDARECYETPHRVVDRFLRLLANS